MLFFLGRWVLTGSSQKDKLFPFVFNSLTLKFCFQTHFLSSHVCPLWGGGFSFSGLEVFDGRSKLIHKVTDDGKHLVWSLIHRFSKPSLKRKPTCHFKNNVKDGQCNIVPINFYICQIVDCFMSCVITIFSLTKIYMFPKKGFCINGIKSSMNSGLTCR